MAKKAVAFDWETWQVGLTAGVLGLVLVVAGLVNRDGDLTAFVVAGEALVEADLADPGLRINPGSGYDGQFYYRLAISPFDRSDRVGGVQFDEPPVRQQRIVYPLVVGLVAGFNPARVPLSLVLVNVAAYVLLGVAAAARARQLTSTGWWGLMVVLYPGFAISLLFGLADVLAAALLVAALVASNDRRWVVAATLFTLAALTRETTLIVPLVGGLVWVVNLLRKRPREVPLPVFVAPVGVAVAWQGLLWLWWGELPTTAGAALNLGVPFSGLVANIAKNASDPTGVGVTSVAVALMVWLLVVMFGQSHRPTTASATERHAWVAAVVLMAMLGEFMYSGPQHFLRAFAEVFTLGSIMLVGDPAFIESTRRIRSRMRL